MNEHPEAQPPIESQAEAAGAAHPPVIEHAPTPEPAPAVVVRRRGGTPLLLTLLLALATGGGLYWVWTNPKPVELQQAAVTDHAPGNDAATAQVGTQVQAMGQQLQTLSGRLDALEKRPASPPAAAPDGAAQPVGPGTADLAKRLDDLSAHVDALAAKQEAFAQKPAEPATPPAQDASPGADAIISSLRPSTPQSGGPTRGMRIDRPQQAAPAPDEAESAPDQKIALDALDQRLAKLEKAVPPPDPSQTIAEQKTTIDQIDQRLAKLEHANPTPDPSQTIAGQKTAIDGLQQRLAKLEQASQSPQQDPAAQQTQTAVSALDTRVQKLEQGAGDVRGVAKDASRAIRLEAAQTALAAGQPLGSLPGAPPALARFATTSPPTETSLRSAWPQVEAAARAASQPDFSKRSFLDRALARLQQSVTVRQGDQVIVGDPASGILNHARQALDNGDLKGAADTLATLNGPAAAAAHDWVAQVHALLEARAALVAMARS